MPIICIKGESYENISLSNINCFNKKALDFCKCEPSRSSNNYLGAVGEPVF